MPTDVIFPRMDQGMTAGVLSEWLVEDGASVTPGEPIATIETEKVNVDLESPAAGTIRRYATAGEDVDVGAVVAIIVAGDEQPLTLETPQPREPETAQQPAPSPRARAATALAPAVDLLEGVEAVLPLDRSGWRRPHELPPRRRRRIDHAIAAISDPAVTSPAAATAVAQPGSTGSPAAYTVVPVNAARRTVMRVVQRSAQIPQFAVEMDVSMHRTLRMLTEIRELGSEEMPTVTDLVIRAVALAAAAEPTVNSTMVDDEIRQHSTVDLNLLVAAGADLYNPVIRQVGSQTLSAISAHRRRLVAAARGRALDAGDLAVGTMTLSNLGTSRIDAFTAMIFPPQAAVVAVARARTEKRLAPMHVSIGVDHRVVNGAQAAAFADVLRDLLENPLAILVN